MACYDESPYTCTYDSGGNGSLPGGGNPDYSNLDTWETASDNDLSGTGITILDCYDSQNHDDKTEVVGATNTDATHYRKIQSSSSCSTPFAGKDATGANFIYTGASSTTLGANETWSRVVNLCAKNTNQTHAATCGADHAKLINLVLFNSNFYGMAFINPNNGLAYNCIAYGNGDNGFFFNVASGEITGAICCTAINNGDIGFYSNNANGTTIVWGSYGADNTNGDFRDVGLKWQSPSGWNAAKGTTADLGAAAGDNYKNSIDYTGSMDADYLATAHISANGNAGDRCGRNPYNDVIATSDFDDFLRNDTAGDPLFSKDIAGNERPNEAVADAVWDVGASEYVAVGGVAPTGALYGPLVGPMGGPI